MKMKTKLIIMLLSSLFALETVARPVGNRIVIISDTHLLAPALVTPGQAIDVADARDIKMMTMSDDIMSAITDSIIAISPDLVLITGDLTNNGERLSHERMVEHLDRMVAHPLSFPATTTATILMPSAMMVTRLLRRQRLPARSLPASIAIMATAKRHNATRHR